MASGVQKKLAFSKILVSSVPGPKKVDPKFHYSRHLGDCFQGLRHSAHLKICFSSCPLVQQPYWLPELSAVTFAWNAVSAHFQALVPGPEQHQASKQRSKDQERFQCMLAHKRMTG